MISILGYGCSSAAGVGSASLWQGLTQGRDFSSSVNTETWPVRAAFAPMACTIAQTADSMKDRLVSHLLEAFSETNFSGGEKLGVIFASSKGCIEDFVWQPTQETKNKDPLTPCLEAFVRRSGLNPQRTLSVSNSCASGLSAIYLASQWLESKRLEDVLVVAADGIGPFVLQGFRCLGALSPTRCRPFAENRDGLRLGEGAAVVWLSTRKNSGLEIRGVGLDVEGHAVTRSAVSGTSLQKAIYQTNKGSAPHCDLIIGHGTGTLPNDAVEDRVFSAVFGKSTPPVTATKWSIGHTLGASGLLDTIAACEIVKNQRAFPIASTEISDPTFRANYLVGHSSLTRIKEVLVSSLGFGGVHGALRVGEAR